jgi:hypothetical protein
VPGSGGGVPGSGGSVPDSGGGVPGSGGSCLACVRDVPGWSLGRDTIPSDFRSIPQSFQTDAEIALQIIPRPLPSTSSENHCSLSCSH